MDSVDKKILNSINTAFPILQRPYLRIAQDLDIPEADVIKRVHTLKKNGVIRRIGAVIDPNRIGWHSTLCAADVPHDMIDEYSRVVNAFAEVTHNYLREGSPNCWFTLITPSEERAAQIISEIKNTLGIDIQDLPARTVFKIRVRFDLK